MQSNSAQARDPYFSSELSTMLFHLSVIMIFSLSVISNHLGKNEVSNHSFIHLMVNVESLTLYWTCPSDSLNAFSHLIFIGTKLGNIICILHMKRSRLRKCKDLSGSTNLEHQTKIWRPMGLTAKSILNIYNLLALRYKHI